MSWNQNYVKSNVKSTSQRQKVCHDVNSGIWRHNYIMTSKNTSWHQKHVMSSNRMSNRQNYSITSNSTSWHQIVHQIVCMTSKSMSWCRKVRLGVKKYVVNMSWYNKATRSPEISLEQVQKLTPQFLLYIYIGYRFPLSLSTIWGNHLPVNFMLKFPTCISAIWRNHLPPPPPHLTSKWRGTFQYFQSHDKIPYIYYLEKPPPI